MSGRILIVDDLATNRIILKVKLTAACYDTLQAADGATALEIARRELPTLILLDMVLPDISGIEVCRQLRADPRTRNIPVVIITASGDRAARLSALEAGADEFLNKPLNEVVLLARIRSLLRAHQTEAELQHRLEACGQLDLAEGPGVFVMPERIAMIAAEPAVALAWRSLLAPHVSARLSVMTPAAALGESPASGAPDLYMIAADLGAHGSGLGLLADLRSRAGSRDAATCIVLPSLDSRAAAMALDMGASDMLHLPLDPQETALRLGLHLKRKRRADALRRALNAGLQLAITDPLTGLFNRRYGMAQMERIATRAQTSGRGFAVMVLDIDRFKSVNDTHGHAAGDAVLEGVAQRLRASLRPTDLLARIGGEEFLVVLPDATIDAARKAGQRLCHVVSDTPVEVADLRLPVTVSVGLAMGPAVPAALVHSNEDAFDTSAHGARIARETLARADAALLIAKSDGRNQVIEGSAA
ncbi:MAG: diguanylate cyclase [Paracoccaceae bacterium]